MKSEFTVSEITIDQAKTFIRKHHYLKDIWGQFEVVYHKFYGLFRDDELVGAVQYTSYRFYKRSWNANHFGCEAKNPNSLWEICRLAVAPIKEYNITSWFLSRTIKLLRENEPVDFIISVADARMHNGCIYAACNFDYYGLMKGRVSNMEDYHFHVFGKSYNGTECYWRKIPFEKNYEISL